jgi:hypothetical protein
MLRWMIRTPLILLVGVLCCIHQPTRGEEVPATGLDRLSFGSPMATEQCSSAFRALPAEDQRGNLPRRGFSGYIHDNENVYRQYLQACFNRWDDLQDYSKEFLDDVYGALFFKGLDGLTPICSAFRMARNQIVTARHCIYDGNSLVPAPTQFVFRLISAPAQDIPVVGE